MSATAEMQSESLHRAITGYSTMNYNAILQGFIAKGIPAEDIRPRENVFTFNAWKALGRIVQKGQHGVKVLTFVSYADKATGENKSLPRTVTVFHASQTKTAAQT